jgi:predicted DCC family thiol-disulfide oxidoreductase YuxK
MMRQMDGQMDGPTANLPPAPLARPVVVYDAACAYCRRQVERIRRRDTKDAFAYFPRQTEGLEQRFPALVEETFDSGMRLVHEDEAISVGADAVYQIARRLGGWRRFAWLYRVPLLRGLFRIAYAWIARNRHRLARDCEGTCGVDAG